MWKKEVFKDSLYAYSFKKHLKREWKYLVSQFSTLTFKFLPKKKSSHLTERQRAIVVNLTKKLIRTQNLELLYYYIYDIIIFTFCYLYPYVSKFLSLNTDLCQYQISTFTKA